MEIRSLPTIGNYGEYSSGNYGAHTLVVDIGPIRVWFSYTTPVAFHVSGHQRVVHENVWSKTTGKHLNWIDRGAKDRRVSGDEFERLYKEQVEALLNPPVPEPVGAPEWAVGALEGETAF